MYIEICRGARIDFDLLSNTSSIMFVRNKSGQRSGVIVGL